MLEIPQRGKQPDIIPLTKILLTGYKTVGYLSRSFYWTIRFRVSATKTMFSSSFEQQTKFLMPMILYALVQQLD